MGAVHEQHTTQQQIARRKLRTQTNSISSRSSVAEPKYSRSTKRWQSPASSSSRPPLQPPRQQLESSTRRGRRRRSWAAQGCPTPRPRGACATANTLVNSPFKTIQTSVMVRAAYLSDASANGVIPQRKCGRVKRHGHLVGMFIPLVLGVPSAGGDAGVQRMSFARSV